MAMTRKLLSLLLVSASIVSTLYSQSDVRRQINAIKMDESYIKAEANDTVESAALDMAALQLVYDYNAAHQEQPLDSVSVEVLKPAMQSLVYARGSIKRVLVFIEVEVADSLMQAYKATLKDPQSTAKATNVTSSPSSSVGNLVLLLSDVEMADEAVKLMTQGKEEGKVTEFGQLHSIQDIPDQAYLLIYDRQRAVRAILSPSDSGYFNVKRNCPDSITNYSGCGALWFR